MRADRRDVRREGRFETLYVRHYPSIYAFVHRRSAEIGGEVSDVVAEVFAVAWRRLDHVPAPPEDRLWLYGVARRCVARARRAGGRRRRLQGRLADEARVPGRAGAEDPRVELIRVAVERLRPAERDAVRLVMWESLTHEQAGRVLGCSANAVALRIHKARKRLEAELDRGAAAPVPDVELESRS